MYGINLISLREIDMEELPLDHEPSLDHWAKCIADDDIATGECTNWDYAYEQAWHQLDAEGRLK
jgi:hypothetical protein